MIDIPIADDHIYAIDGSERLLIDKVKIIARNSTANVAIKTDEVDHTYQELSTQLKIENPKCVNDMLLIDIPDGYLMQDGIWKIRADVKQVLMEL